MNRKQAFDTLATIASQQGISIENRIRPDGDWMVTPLSCFRVVEMHDESMIYLGPHRVAAVIGHGRKYALQAERIAVVANQGKADERARRMVAEVAHA